MKILKRYSVALATFGLFILFTILTAFVDKAEVVAGSGNKVGFSEINRVFYEKFGGHEKWEIVSTIIVIICLIIAMAPFIRALILVIKNKSLKAIPYEVWMLVIVYLLMIAFYVIFIFLVINRRPIMVGGKYGSSYPSSHCLLIMTILGLTIVYVNYFCKSKKLKIATDIVAIALMVVMGVSRIAIGAHWLTDVIGAILLSMTLIALYLCLVKPYEDSSKTTKVTTVTTATTIETTTEQINENNNQE